MNKTKTIMMASLMVTVLVAMPSLNAKPSDHQYSQSGWEQLPGQTEDQEHPVMLNAPYVSPIGTIRHNERGPESLLDVVNNTIAAVIGTFLDSGTWLVTGSDSMQYGMQLGVSGTYVYTWSALSHDTNILPGKGLSAVDARPYSTKAQNGHQNLFWWFANNPPPRTFVVPPNGEMVYTIVLSNNGGFPVDCKTYGAVLAVKITQ